MYLFHSLSYFPFFSPWTVGIKQSPQSLNFGKTGEKGNEILPCDGIDHARCVVTVKGKILNFKFEIGGDGKRILRYLVGILVVVCVGGWCVSAMIWRNKF